MSVGQKLAILKIRSKLVTFLSFRNLEAAPEEAMQLRRLIKSSNENLGPYLFRKFEFWRAEIYSGPLQSGYNTSKSPHLIGLTYIY